MKAIQLIAPGEIVIDEVPDPRIETVTDAVVRVVAAGICGTDLRGYAGRPGPVQGPACGHEFVGVVEDVGTEVATVRRGDVVVAPFMFSDGTCTQCRHGVPSSCRSGGMWGVQAGGAQAEGIRVPYADGTLIPVPIDEHDERIPAVLTLSDVMSTGRYALDGYPRGVPEIVAVVGDGPVGLCSVLAARAAGVEQVLLLGHHEERLLIGKRFGATEVVTARGPEAWDQVLEATGEAGADLVVEGVGEQSSLDTAFAICADGGTISLVGGPHGSIDPMGEFLRNITLTGGLAPARRYMPALVDDVLAGRLDPSPIFDATVTLDAAGQGYRAMASRQATKAMIKV